MLPKYTEVFKLNPDKFLHFFLSFSDSVFQFKINISERNTVASVMQTDYCGSFWF